MNRWSARGTVRSKMVRSLLGLMLLAAGVGLSIGAPKHPEPINVGMIALLASPQKYNGKIIQTIGFLHIGSMHEDDNLWLHEEDRRFFLYKDSFSLNLSDDQRKQFIHLNNTYVLITGTLHSKGPEGRSMDSGIIVRITALDGWYPYRPSPPAKTE
jgi:hypothetical protein